MKYLSRPLNIFYTKHVASHFRALPSYIIVGTMKGGTTSMYAYLCMHPNVCSASAKEVHYFDFNYTRGMSWYKMHFPLKKNILPGHITGEASPYYLAHPCVPERIYKVLPEVRLIAILRNPIERAYSHYQHNRRLKVEPFTFEDALELEDERIAGEEQRLLENSSYQSHNHAAFSYKKRGQYAEQLKRWFQYFKREQMLILKSEDLFRDPGQVTSQVFGFLGLDVCKEIQYEKHNYFGGYSNMPANARARLAEHFSPYNQELYNLLGVDYNWQ